jgi:tetratricopeptide (TPR) repeat protein
MKDKRWQSLVIFIVAALLLATLIGYLPQSFVTGHQNDYLESTKDPSYSKKIDPALQRPTTPELMPEKDYVSGSLDPLGHAKTQQQNVQLLAFNDAVTLMQYNHFEQAVVKWHAFLGQYPDVIEAHVNLGYTFAALAQWQFAKSAFEHALELKNNQANAYYGLALVAEAEANYEVAMGYMKTFLHLEHDKGFDVKANAALWVWEEKLKPDYVTEKDETAQ